MGYSLSFIDDVHDDRRPVPIIRYPKARRDETVVDNYHGFPVADPYRWLEDPDSEETKEFVKSQVDVTESVLERCEAREKIRDRIKEQFNHPRYTPPFKRGDRYFYWHNTGLQPQDVLYVQDNIDDELEAAEVVIDPNKLSDDGSVSLKVCAVSEDAKYLAYGLSSNGSDWINIRVMRIGEQTIKNSSLKWVKFSSIAWTHDNKGFFYCRYSTPTPNHHPNHDETMGTVINVNMYHEVWYHYIGTDQSEDILCWRDDDNPKYIFTPSVTEDGKFVLLYIEQGSGVNRKVYYLDLSSLPNGISRSTSNSSSKLPFVKLIDEFKASYIAVANDGPVFTFLTNRDAPRYKLARVDIINNMMNWNDVVKENNNNSNTNTKTMVLDSAYAVDSDKLLLKYLCDVKSVLQIRDLKTGTHLHTLPIGIGTVCGVSIRRRDPVFFLGFTNFLIPGIIYKCEYPFHRNLINNINNIPQPQIKIFRQISIPHFDHSQFQIQQVFIPSSNRSKDNKDIGEYQYGTKIPTFIVAKKDLVLNGSHPCLLYGYGGFNISLVPFFSVARIVLLKHLDLVYAVANIRGGGEYGEDWHRAGSLSNKQNCFDDFISVAEFLIKNGYTRPRKICIEGRSNGGLLVGACINQRPDLFGCALAHVAVMDMLRFHKFTIGHAWTCDFGSSDIEEQFQWLIKYSPLHNVKRPWELLNSSGSGSRMCTDDQQQRPLVTQLTTQYPATMLLTADHDDRVVPSHSLKLLATMQYVLCSSMETSPQTNPILGRIECNAGHGCGRPTQKLIDEAADRYGFMAKMLGVSWID